MSLPTRARLWRVATRALAAGIAAVTAATAVTAVATAVPPRDAAPSELQRDVAALGLQQSDKREPTAGEIAGSVPTRGVNPYLVPTPPEDADYHYWDTLLAARAAGRASQQSTERGALAAPVPVVDELEPDDLLGRNDTTATGELVPLAPAPSDVRVLCTLADPGLPAATVVGPFAEDDGAIGLASPTGLSAANPAVRVAATIGDGPHGSAGDATGDFDVYALPGLTAGQQVTADIDAAVDGSPLDALAVLLAADGTVVALDDDGPRTDTDSFLQAEVPADGDYVLAVTAFGSLPADPFDSGSGSGVTTEGVYALEVRLDFAEDIDVYAVDLEAGDVVSATVSGAAGVLGLVTPDGTLATANGRDLTGGLPADTPLLGGGNATVDHVAATSGRHYVQVNRGTGTYDLRVRRLRPGLESAAAGEKQVVFVDLDGAQLNTVPLGGPGVRTLSGLGGFLGGWGLGPDDEDAVVDAALAEIEDNLVTDPRLGAANPSFDVEIRNSRDHADPSGEPNVTRVVVGGSVPESGVDTISVSESFDPGNYDTEQLALVQLDRLSAPAGSPNTINNLVTPDTDVPALVGFALGLVTSFHASQLVGSDFTDGANGVASLMDVPLGGPGSAAFVSLGPDLAFGTEDDVDVDLATDALAGRVGTQDTLNRVAWGLSSGGAVALPGAPEDVAAEADGRRVRVTWNAPADAAGLTGYVVRAVRDGSVVATETVDADRTRARFVRLAAGTYTVTVAATSDAGEGAAATSAPVTVGRRG